MELRPEDLKIGGRYRWTGQPERLVYMGEARYAGDPRRWHQFALVDNPTVCWSEVLDSDVPRFEEIPVVFEYRVNVVSPQASPVTLSHRAGAGTRRPGENRAQHRARMLPAQRNS